MVRRLLGWTSREWLTAAGAAAAIALVVALRNYYLYDLLGRPLPFLIVLAAEAPVWLGWLILMPAVIWLSRHFPPLGALALRNAVIHVISGLIASFIPWLMLVLVRSMLPMPGPDPRQPGFLRELWSGYVGVSFQFLFMYGMGVGLVLAWTYNREEVERRSREATLHAMLARAERDLLRAQIQPHFLFNTLNTISALLAQDPAGARRMVIRLGDLLRLLLDDDARHEVTLREELSFLAHYIEIQRIRFQDRLTVEQNVDGAALGFMVPRLLLQPLVENAVQHGIAPREESGRVWITASEADGVLSIEIADDGPGPSRASTLPVRSRGAGLGIANTRARLRQLYGDAASLEIGERPGGGALVQVRLPAHETEIASA